ncbi:ABC-type sugar transport system ATPase subunit [Microbacterium foliorum]|uniref:sugar ABC transporter ATP-binding protein n=1 Tax=Microbacterium foliorum TaxID=104336 RepID=UPI00209FA216|nr:sugar ABC transporter ATP-binding protein [Microbacterium foliorum]MCP1430698.1 ABC-type sugar transport system ATPase subunit [Microbacterium foliorum]
MSSNSSLSTPRSAVSLRGVEKSFVGVRALKGVDLELLEGRVTALAGENGAGKSTLIKILAGAISPDAGEVSIFGNSVDSDPLAVIRAGVSVIYQELTYVPEMTVTENLFLGEMPSAFGFVSKRAALVRARSALARVGLSHVDPDAAVGSLSMSERQLVEIARSLARDAHVLVFDEPTSSLPESEVEILKQVIRGLRDEGLAILYISHHLAELFDISDEIVVMRDGAVVGHRPTSEWDESSLVSTMLAKSLERAYPWQDRELGDVVFEAKGINARRVNDVSIVVREREIVGLVGLAGAGRTELMKAVSGADGSATGALSVRGRSLRAGNMGTARRMGVVYIPEDRKREGIVPEASVGDNIIYGNYSKVSKWGWIVPGSARTFISAQISSFDVRTDSRRQLISRLSGGNQQKVILSRFTAGALSLLMLDDPTRGVDVGSKSSIYEKAFGLAAAGAGILMTSSDTDEVLAVSDRVYVMKSGRVVAEIHRKDYDREAVLALASLG